jgi:hypothetical protein
MLINNQKSSISYSRATITSVTFPAPPVGATVIPMSTGTGPARNKCAQCEQPESSCECEKFCCLCQSVIDIRFCEDGLMYCEPCRKACDYKTSSD